MKAFKIPIVGLLVITAIAFALPESGPTIDVLVIGDSWANACPPDLFDPKTVDKAAQDGATLDRIRAIISEHTPLRAEEVVIIISGLNDESVKKPLTKADILDLAQFAKKKFSAETVTIYDPASLRSLLDNPDNWYDDSDLGRIHLNQAAYRHLKTVASIENPF